MLLDLLSGKERAPAECVIEVDRRPIAELYPFLIEATVETGRTEPATATLVFETRRDERGDWNVQDAFGFDPREPILADWKPITIRAAFGMREEEVMRGFIRQLRAEHPEDAGAARFTVECQDASMQLDREHVRKTWGTEEAPTTDASILQQLLAPYSADLRRDGDNGLGQNGLKGLNQDGTDIQFLKARAEANGYELMFRDGAVYFGPMRLQGTAQATIMVYAGPDTNCLSMTVTSDSHQADEVRYVIPGERGAQSRDGSRRPNLHLLGTTHADSSTRGLRPLAWTVTAEASADESRLQALAQRKANDFDIHKLQAEGELDGTLYGHVLLPGRTVGVDGLGSRMSGVYYVDTVTHTFNAQGYRQKFKLLRNAYGDNLGSAGASPLARLAALL